MELDLADKSLLTQEKLNLKSWGLPKAVLEKYSSKGIEHMFPWQLECLASDGVLSGRNLVYSAPTSAGKTMVAEILTIQTVLERKKKVIIILPFISVVREKMLYFQSLLGSCGIRVEGFMGSHSPVGGLRSVHIAVCTIEKANSLINRMLEEQNLDAVGCVVVDEIHLLGDSNRGYLLELLLTKLKYMCYKDKTLNIQIVGMSATLPNISELAKWLDAALYTTEFRPIPLTEYLKVNSNIYEAGSSTMELKYAVKPIVKFKSDPGDVIHLCLEALLSGHSVLVFCPTRNWCETCAQQIAAEFRRIGYEGGEVGLAVRAQLDGSALSDVIEQLKRCPASLDLALGKSVAFGVAFHHAGLTMDERDIVEGAFRATVVRVLVATSTLSSGVNLPARRVLIRCPPRNKSTDVLTYRQMVGRAGRLGKDTQGESFLICNGSERVLGEQLVKAELPAVQSTLADGDLSSSLKRAVLEVIASGVVNCLEDVELYAKSTFLASCEDEEWKDPLAACVEYLQTNEFIRVREGTLGPTAFAEACLAASLSPDMGLKLLAELHRARQCFVLESELHVIYQVTPFSVSEQWGQLDWLRVLSLWEDLPISMKRVGELVGVEERFLIRAVRGTININSNDQKLSIHRRFYIALALQDLVNEVPLPQVAVKFNCTKGMLQSLQQSASTFAGMVTQFSRRLGWSNIELLVGQFCARLQFGAQRELLDLLRLDCLTAVQARALYTAGIQTLADLATAATSKLERALSRASPFQSETEESEVCNKRCVWLIGHNAFSEAEAAQILIQESRQFLQRELGLKSASWEDSTTISENDISDSSTKIQSPNNSPQLIGKMITLPNEGLYDDEAKCEQEKISSLDIKKSNTCNQQQQVSSCFMNEKSPKLSQEICSFDEKCLENNIDENYQQISHVSDNHKSVKESKRESLDMFDSSDNIENNGNDSDCIFEISSDNIFLNTSKQKCTSSQTKSVTDEDERCKNIYCPATILNEAKKENSHTSEEKIKTPRESLLNAINTKNTKFNDNISTSTPHNPTLLSKNVFFDSPLPCHSSKLENSFDQELDANFGGESLLEMSSFGTGYKKQKNENSLLEENIRDCSLIELSTYLAGTEEKKRKFSFGDTNLSKKIRSNCVDLSQNEVMLNLKELQVSKVTSTDSVIISNQKMSSNYFEESFCINSDSYVENIKFDINSKIQTNNCTNADFNNSIKHDDCINEGEPSFELHMSSDQSQNELISDNELNIQSNICDILIGSPKELQCNGVQRKLPISKQISIKNENMYNDYVNNESNLKKVVPDVFSQNVCDKDHKHSSVQSDFSNTNQLSNSNSLIVDSELNSLIEENKVEIQNKHFEPALITKEASNNIDDDNNCYFNDTIEMHSKLRFLLDQRAYIPKETKTKITDTKPQNNYNEINASICSYSSQPCEGKIPMKMAQSEKSRHLLSKSNYLKTSHCKTSDISVVESNPNVLIDINTKETGTSANEICKNVKSDSNNVFAAINRNSHPSKSTINMKISKNTVSLMSKSTEKALKKLFNNSDFDIDSQLCNILDGKIKDDNQKDVVEPTCDKPEWTESMEIKEILDLHFDEDTIFGTPVPDNKSLSVKEYVAKKSKQTKSSFGDKSVMKTNLFKKPLSNKIVKAPSNNNNDQCKTNREDSKPYNIDVNLPSDENKQSSAGCNSLTNSFLENAFDSSFSYKTFEPEVVGPKDSCNPTNYLQKSVSIINSPPVNITKSEVEVINISIDEPITYENFRKSILTQEVISMVLTTREMSAEDDPRGQVIGAKIMKKIKEIHFPYCDEGIALISVTVCLGENKVYVLSLDSQHCDISLECLREVLRNKDLTLSVWEVKQAIVLLQRCCQVVTKARLSDPTVAHWLLQPHASTPTLKQMARMYSIPAPQCSSEAGFQALLVWQLSAQLKARLKQEELYSIYTGMEMPIQALLAGMEVVGVFWDKEYADLLWTSVEDKMAELQTTLYSLAGRKFNQRSRIDLSRVQSLMKSSSVEIMKEYKAVLRNWRVLNSLKTRNLSPLLMQEGACIRGCWETHTVTGRISMREPSLQHVPRDIIIDDQVFSLRSAFTARQDCTLVGADYCQLELRLLAHYSQDACLLNTLSQPGDVFVALAAEWNNVPLEQVKDSMRQHTKQLCYGLVYGMGLRSLAEELEVEESEAAQMVDKFHKHYPGVMRFIDECVAQCRTRRQVTTLLGRRRYLPDINSQNRALRSQTERRAVNTTIQGSAADISKSAMLKVHNAVHHRGLKAQLIIQLHDELIYEVLNEDVEEFCKILRRKMENAVSVSIPLPVKIKKGPSWGNLETVD